MAVISKSHLMATSAIAGLTLLNMASAAEAQDAFGIRNDQPDLLEVTVAEGDTVEGSDTGVFAAAGPVTVMNSGTIRGNGTNLGGPTSLPSAGVMIAEGVSTVINSGTISGAANGITTVSFFNAATGQLEGRARDTIVVNTGTISGEGDDGVRLTGGGSVDNAGTITGTGNAGADGISMFPYTDQANADYSASVLNRQGGTVTGDRFGIILSAGGEVENAGAISGGNGGVLVQGTALNVAEGEDRSGLTASVTNTGAINGAGDFGFGGINGYGVGFAGDLATATLVNSGTITSAFNRGVNHGSLADLTVTNEATGQIEGATSGIYSGSGGTLTVVNAGTIRGNGAYDGFDAAPDAGITIATAGSSVTNSGTISGAGAGVTSVFFFNFATNSLEGLAVGTAVVNTGTITGESNHGVRLIGGGSLENSGTITGGGGPLADGVTMFRFQDLQLAEGYSASVSNLAEGIITGERFGIILGGGGIIDNAGTVTGGTGGVSIQSQAGGGTGVQVASLTNTGMISGANGAGAQFSGTLGPVTLANSGAITGTTGGATFNNASAASLTNSGTITGEVGHGVQFGPSSTGGAITNEAGGTIAGQTSGVIMQAGVTTPGATVTLVNAGTIRGEGVTTTVQAPFEAGVRLQSGTTVVTNSGTISGAQFGIVTNQVFVPELQTTAWRVGPTSVTNTGLIEGGSSDAIGLFGGGTIVNSGSIIGGSGPGADGIQLQFFPGQDSGLAQIGSIDNQADGTITGERYGIILAGGGTIRNAGAIAGGTNGIALVSQNFGGKTGFVDNLGTIEGGVLVDLDAGLVFNSGRITNANGAAVLSEAGSAQFEGALNATGLENTGVIEGSTQGVLFTNAGNTDVTNSGRITGIAAEGIRLAIGNLGGDFANQTGGLIEGATSGIVVQGGSISLDNAGMIRGNGVAANSQAAPEGGLRLQAGENVISNTGTISGAQYGIVTTQVFIPETQALQWRVERTEVSNSGTISGEANDGIILFGGGSVTNSGTISGQGSAQADGVQMQFFNGQDTSPAQIGSVVNEADGTISGDRYGIILAGGGTVSNAGVISGGTNGVLLVSQNLVGKTGSLDNRGTIEGGVLINLASADVSNIGTINNANGAGVQIDGGQIAFVNAGRISGDGTAIRFGAADDELILLTGSIIDGTIDGGEGFDTLFLDGEVLELTEAQQLGEAIGFESLRVEAGYWTTSGLVGAFDTVAIEGGAALQINQITGTDGGAVSSLLAPAIANNGALVLNFADDAALNELGARAVTGSGTLQLAGEGVLTVAGANLAHMGGTSIGNGGLVLTGTLLGDVTTQGDGFFQLGAGATEGVFTGNIVNDGRFVFNRSDNYDFLGNFSGTGVLEKLGAGVLIFSGDYAFSGITNILAGSVRIGGIIDPTTEFNLDSGGTLDIAGNDQTIAALSGAEDAMVELGEQTLTINQQINTTFGGSISGSGGIAKDGDGRLELTGDSTYTGPTDINGGILSVNGSIISPVTVNQGGTLGGNGSVGNTTIAGGGIVAPGNSIGRLTVNGDLDFAAGSIFELEVNAAGGADRIDATGRITIASTAQVAVLAEGGAYRPRTDYTVLTAEGGVTGQFDTVTTDLAFLTPFLRYGANAVTLSLYRNDIEFAAVAGNGNQAGVARAVQALGIDNSLFEAVLVQDAASARATFAGLTGELHASTISGLTDDSRHLRNALLTMPVAAEPGLFAWGSGFGGWGDFESTAANSGMDMNHNGFVTGIGIGGDGFGVALSGGLGGSEFSLIGRADNADVESKYLALHGNFALTNGLRGAAGLSYAWHDVATSRALAAPVAQVLTAQTDARTFQLFGEIGYDAQLGSVALTPFARLAHVGTRSDALAEMGGAAALAVRRVSQDTTFLSLGTRATLGADNARFKPYAGIAWNRAFGDRRASLASTFASGGPGFTVTGVWIPQDSAEVDAGLDYTAGKLSIGASYNGVLAGDRTVHGGRISARLVF